MVRSWVRAHRFLIGFVFCGAVACGLLGWAGALLFEAWAAGVAVGGVPFFGYACWLFGRAYEDLR